MNQNEIKSKSFIGSAKVLLILINLSFLYVGSILIYYSIIIRNNGWLDIFNNNYSYLKNGFFGLFIGFGILICILSLFGCITAWTRRRKLLLYYLIIICISFIIFIIIMIFGILSKNISNHWKKVEYPASNKEVSIAESFDKIYCYSHGIYICNSANVTKSLEIYFPNISSSFGSLLNKIKGLNTVCDKLGNKITLPTVIDGPCTICKEIKKYEKYKVIYEWTMNKCIPTTNVSLWCGTFLQTNKNTIHTVPYANDTPYHLCRIPFINIWYLWSTRTVTIGLIFSLSCLFIFGLAFILRKKKLYHNHTNSNFQTLNSPRNQSHTHF